MTLRAGVARIDVTPPLGYRLQGHVKRTSPAAGVHDPLAGKVLTFSDGARRLAIVTLDLIYFASLFYDRVRRRVREQHGIPAEALVIACSHTHTGPFVIQPPEGDSPDYRPDYMDRLEEWISDAIGQAIRREQPAQLKFASGSVDIGIINRRLPSEKGVRLAPNPEGPVDLTCPVLRVDGTDGRPMAVLFQYACHPTTLGSGIDQISADYPGEAQRDIEQAYPGCAAMFLNGCCGDIRPAIVDEQGGFAGGDFTDVQRLGRRLAEHVITCMDRAAPLRAASLDSRLTTHRYAFDPDLMPVDDVAMRRSVQTLSRLNPAQADAIAQWGQRWRDRSAAGSSPPPGDVQGAVQVLHLGEVSLVALTGEVMVDIALSLRQRHEGPLLIAGYAQGAIGYIPTRQALAEGGYETQAYLFCDYPGPFAPDMAERLVERVQALLGEQVDGQMVEIQNRSVRDK